MAVSPSGFQRREIYIDARDLQSDSDPDNPLSPDVNIYYTPLYMEVQ